LGTNSKIIEPENPIIFFDGVCNLCNGAVRFIIKRDKNQYFRFASLQSDTAKSVLPKFGINPDSLESIIVYENDVVYRQSNAILRIAKNLSGPWSLLTLGWLVPKPLRDWIYNFVAKNRYQWFGRKDECMVPTPELSSRFL